MSKAKHTPTPTIITVTLPETDSDGTLLIQRGDLARMSRFSHTAEADFTALIQQALIGLTVVESDPPVIPDAPPRKTTPKPVSSPQPAEPMLDIPTKSKKRTTQVPARLVQITGGETEDATQEQALKVAGRLLDSELWDGKTPIDINDAPAVLRKLDGLSDKELKLLYTLEEFVQVDPRAGDDEPDPPQGAPAADDEAADAAAVEDRQAAAAVLNVSNTTDQSGLI